jgi:hypothetical protein
MCDERKQLQQRNAELEAEFVKFRKSSDTIISIMTDRNLELETLLFKAQQVLFAKIARIKELETELARLHQEESEEQSFMYGDWEVLAWNLCEEEYGEDSCSELVWEGHPPEPWGEQYLKYEYEAKVMIEKVRKFAPEPKPAQEIPAELIAWVRMQRNDIPATGEEFANAIELWLEDKRKGGA